MNRYVVDTSTIAAWYLPEKFSKGARAWQQQCLSGAATLLAPALHYWELGNVLRTYVRRGELDAALAAEVYELHLLAPVETAEPDRAKVLACALEYQATVYDAVFIQLALELDVPLVTAEKSTTPWVVRLGERVRSVR